MDYAYPKWRWDNRIKAAALLFLVIGVVGIFHVVFKRGRLRAAYQTLAVSDSRARLIEQLGQPDQVLRCSDTAVLYPNAACREILEYHFLYESWTYAFDRDGKLVQRVECWLGEYCSEVGK